MLQSLPPFSLIVVVGLCLSLLGGHAILGFGRTPRRAVVIRPSAARRRRRPMPG